MNHPSPPVGVIGLGRSGIAAVRFLAARGTPVIAWDANPATLAPLAELPGVTPLRGAAPPVESLSTCATLLLSPGVPRALPEMQTLIAAGIPVINDVEWLHAHVRAQRPQARFLAITGSNGKSTVTTLIGLMLQQQGIATAVGGNLGMPALSLWEEAMDAYVLELSSFQLESIAAFRAEVAVHLNLTPDHLDRYPDLAAYGAAKSRIFANGKPGDRLVINADDPNLGADLARARAMGLDIIPFSVERMVPGGVYASEGWLIDGRGTAPVPLVELAAIRIRGIHNQANAAAATAAALAHGVAPEAIVAVLKSFPGLTHRMELVRTLDGVDYYNDSKGTNVGATLMSLQSFPSVAAGGGVILIAGGRDKKGDFAALAPVARRVVAEAILIGEAANDLARALAEGPTPHRAASMTDAVRLARKLARSGQAVLLSPACASFDMFKNFEDRGDQFREAVHELV
ncbi:UDP-N-acetylmuramoylalanine--D-glutamate ligase [Candidatus Magnetaquicoccaceae bacterium FCR-1]|uniref:UDP-N-acetylmuramoylalanine--D-glutamate ligase n=1 Tax=Candidatus Magnetaquiglobus chichijimensis TaxID=3141448 RepID=A0ABQ0CBM3_9PROT